ncbi:MAG: DUF4177 domain-containing protein [Alphaproteobacteria bacterium]
MSKFEYKVITAPRKAERIKGVRNGDDRFAHTITNTINTLAEEGWEYLRAESLPVDEKTSMMGKVVEKYLSLLVFHREKAVEQETPQEVHVEAPKVADPSMLQTLTIDEGGVDEAPSLGPATRD